MDTPAAKLHLEEAALHVYEHVFARARSVNRYQAVYAGINYLILGDRLKLMTGAEYSEMHDSAQDDNEFDGWTYATG